MAQRMDRGSGSKQCTGSPAANGVASSAPAGGDASTDAHFVGSHGWWTPSPLGPFFRPPEGMYPTHGFTNLLQSNVFGNHYNANNGPENFHHVGSTTKEPPVTPISGGTPATEIPSVHEVNAEDSEIFYVDLNENLDDVRTDKRLNWTKAEDVRLAKWAFAVWRMDGWLKSIILSS